jgi:antitoxin YefM
MTLRYHVQNNVHEHFGFTMDAISYTAARANLANTMAHVCNDHAPIIITRKSEAPVVMMSLEDYNTMQETTFLLRSPANARNLLESIAELEAGKGTERELIE